LFWARERIIIFGAGMGGRNACRFLRHRFKVVAFLDNDTRKHGHRMMGRPIVPPSALSSIRADKVFIASMHSQHIYLQLVKEMKVEPGRIETVHPPILSGEYAVSPWTYVVLTLLATLTLGLILALAIWGYRWIAVLWG
jgi:FlaA1/EpsC-like NDP-sugar epimerase